MLPPPVVDKAGKGVLKKRIKGGGGAIGEKEAGIRGKGGGPVAGEKRGGPCGKRCGEGKRKREETGKSSAREKAEGKEGSKRRKNGGGKREAK